MRAAAALSFASLMLASCQYSGPGPYAGAYGGPPPSAAYTPIPTQAQAPMQQRAAGGSTFWRGRDGGVSNEVTVTPLGGGRHAVKMGGGGNGCGMAVEGVATEVGRGRLRLVKSNEDAPGQCVIDMSAVGNRMSIQEQSCGYWHGARCEFTGTVTRVRG